jgi:hypothetical protein
MASNIDPTKPQSGIDQPVKVIRDNFAAAKSEIENLQDRAPFELSVSGMPKLPSRTTTEILLVAPSMDKAGVFVYCSTIGSIVYCNGSNWINILTGLPL